MTAPVALSADLFRLDGRTALVVGAGSGIGEAIAFGLATFGATVICADSRLDAATVTAERITASNSGDRQAASALALDLLDPDAPATALATIGTPDVLVTT